MADAQFLCGATEALVTARRIEGTQGIQRRQGAWHDLSVHFLHIWCQAIVFASTVRTRDSGVRNSVFHELSEMMIGCAMPRHAQEGCARMTYMIRLFRRVFLWRNACRHPHVRDLKPHLARDIGLDPADMARLTHRHPSQTTHHPRG
jgi:hypothetical protein